MKRAVRSLSSVVGWVLSSLLVVGLSGCTVDDRQVLTSGGESEEEEGATGQLLSDDGTAGSSAAGSAGMGETEGPQCETVDCVGGVALQGTGEQPEPLPSDAQPERKGEPEQESLLGLGQSCDVDGACESGHCRPTEGEGRRCCAVGCPATDRCSADGTACVQQKAGLGEPCVGVDGCESAFCVDGVCCNEACDGACETCADTGLCRAPLDDNACPTVRCGDLDASCADTTTDIQDNRCQAKGVCKSLDACGLAAEGVECPAGFCNDAGECRAPTVNCGGSCETDGLTSGVTCCSFSDTFQLACVDERDCPVPPNQRVQCDEHSDCRDGSVCCFVSTPFDSFISCRAVEDCRPELGVRAGFSEVCAAPGASTSACPVGQQCQRNEPAGHFPDWSFCREPPQ